MPPKHAESVPREKTKLKTYRVYFHQVNQDYHDVKAVGADEAIEKARRVWRRSHGPDLMGSPEEI